MLCDKGEKRMNESGYMFLSERIKEWQRLHPQALLNMELLQPILDEILNELNRAILKHPEPWRTEKNCSLIKLTGVVAVEAGEALRQAYKLEDEGKGSLEDVQLELIQTAATAIRLLAFIKNRGE